MYQHNFNLYHLTIFSRVFNIFRDCELVPLLGFDCEWRSSIGPNRRPVALLQLESYYGVCALIQLRYFSRITAEMKLQIELFQLLHNRDILKIGVASQKDAKFLFNDFNIETQSTFDLRFMAQMAGYKQPGGLKKMCENYLNIPNYEEDYYMHNCWEDEYLPSEAIQYASKDVHNSIELFELFAKNVQSKGLLEMQSSYMKRIIDQCVSDQHLNHYYESCFNGSYRGPKIREQFDFIGSVVSQQSNKKYDLPVRVRCFVCEFSEKHHNYFPCEIMA